ncbi:hypothetical protein ABH994_007484 [Bradyrhizobium yuanmingense]|uniref:hypothetical protein n=1 Tax=Bradyrhizobium yuanmingense TaxID=108015 RepID=UPI0035145347
MYQPSLFEDLGNLVEIAFRIGVRIVAFALACGLLYQAFDAWRSALLGVQSKTSKPDPDPTSMSARIGAAAWGTIAAISTYIFSVMIFGGEAVLATVLKPFSP